MKTKSLQILSLILLAVLLSGCNLPARATATPIIDQSLAGTIVAATLEALQTRVPQDTPSMPLPTANVTDAAVQNSPVPSTTPSPLPTMAASATVTPTFSAPLLVFDSNTNCREGPGTNYKVVTVLSIGQKVVPVGVQGDYWIVNNPNGKGTCWVVTDFATPSGSTWTLATMTAPPSPTIQAPLAPSWSKWNYRCDYASNGYTVTMNLAWSNLSTNISGYRVYRNGTVIATLAADVNAYTDVTALDNGSSLTYYIEVYKDSITSTTSTINASCQ